MVLGSLPVGFVVVVPSSLILLQCRTTAKRTASEYALYGHLSHQLEKKNHFTAGWYKIRDIANQIVQSHVVKYQGP